MICYGVSFITMLVWLFVRLDTHNDQKRNLYKAIMELDTERIYDCELREEVGQLPAKEGEAYSQLFCEKNMTKWNLI